ncbi:MAG TPA: VacJ family lipoprotein [Ramlibacter sp.]|uniref:MlaA family lipoprotein n=1 Tax=Ramlibacter sp. TaxID=1917967 RepID=UPI002ECFDD36
MKLARLKAHRPVAALLIALTLAALQGCATAPGREPNPRDPFEPFNRQVTEFNDGVDRIVLKPSATWYREKVPPLVRTGVSNFFNNLGDAWSAVNALLQFRLQDAEENFARFHLNTMFGVFGIFDPASDLNIERHREDFGQTLGRWGVPAGPYIVLPLLGPSTLRDTLALPVDSRYDPVSFIDPARTRTAMYTLRIVDRRSNLLRVSNVLEEAALDRYSFTRDAFLQRRRAEIFQAEEDQDVPPPLPDESNVPSEPPAATPAAPGQPQATPAR